MAVAHDAATEFATFTTSSPATVQHTPVGTPAGVLVEIDHGSDDDEITGVTYGGVAMERVALVPFPAVPSMVYLYFLGADIPTGEQTVSIAHTGAATVKHATVATVTATGDTEVGAVGTIAAAAANPRVTVWRGPLSGLTYGVIYSQVDDPSELAPLGTMSTITDHDFGTDISRFDRQTTAGTGAYVFGYDDATTSGNSIAAVSIQEVESQPAAVGAQTPPLSSYTTSFAFIMAGQLADADLVLFVTSRDHTAGTALPSVTDDGGGNTWDLIANSSDRKGTLWHKKGVAADVGATVTVSGGVNSTIGGLLIVKGGGETTNIVLEDNASGNETHAGFTPDDDGSVIIFGVFGVTGIAPITNAAGATMGSVEPEFVERSNPGGSDSEIWFTARTLASGATGDFTWDRVNAATKSVSFAVAPVAAAEEHQVAGIFNTGGGLTAVLEGHRVAAGTVNAGGGLAAAVEPHKTMIGALNTGGGLTGAVSGGHTAGGTVNTGGGLSAALSAAKQAIAAFRSGGGLSALITGAHTISAVFSGGGGITGRVGDPPFDPVVVTGAYSRTTITGSHERVGVTGSFGRQSVEGSFD